MAKRKPPTNEAWAKMRRDHLRVFPECRACGWVGDRMEVHHLRYRGRRGSSEQPGDLVTLCHQCHSDLHRKLRPHTTGVKRSLDFIDARRAARMFVGAGPVRPDRPPKQTVPKEPVTARTAERRQQRKQNRERKARRFRDAGLEPRDGRPRASKVRVTRMEP